ncbi:MAG: nitrophenyl compound nitroreductase subunit ArsF family protein [Pirellulaceae bacterium]
MLAKKTATVGLLLFVGATLGALLINSLPARDARDQADAPPAAESSAASVASPSADAALQEGMVAYYFHSDTRCPTCRTIESLAQQAVEDGFAKELAAGTVQWRVVNYQRPESQSAVERYEIVAPIVVLSKVQGGEEIAWKSLDDVWRLTDDKAKFVTYVQEEAKNLQRSAQP